MLSVQQQHQQSLLKHATNNSSTSSSDGYHSSSSQFIPTKVRSSCSTSSTDNNTIVADTVTSNDNNEFANTSTIMKSSLSLPTTITTKDSMIDITKQLLHMILHRIHKDQNTITASNTTTSTTKPLNQLGLLHYLLQRCYEMDHIIIGQQQDNNHSSNTTNHNSFVKMVLSSSSHHTNHQVHINDNDYLFVNDDSGYSLLHDAIYQGDICRILFILRTISNHHNNSNSTTHLYDNQRLLHRPMDILLHNTPTVPPSPSPSSSSLSSATCNTGSGTSIPLASSTSSTSLLHFVVSQTDHEGLTPFMLLSQLQRNELYNCRQYIQQQYQHQQQQTSRPSRSNSFYESHVVTSRMNYDYVDDEQNEFDLLSHSLQFQQRHRSNSSGTNSSSRNSSDNTIMNNNHSTTDNNNNNNNNRITYGCEVITFGRAHHCALGVVASQRTTTASNSSTTSSSSINNNSKKNNELFRPQRVTTFALQDRWNHNNTTPSSCRNGSSCMGPSSAIAIACSTYHTLTLTSSGQLYSYGLGKGGRLGTGNELPCSIPTLIHFIGLSQPSHKIIAIAAAENHSLCVTNTGIVYAFGSNGFGQLGISTSNSTGNSTSGKLNNNSRCYPRKVDDLKQVICINVAAGLKHSVALSKDGEVYVWGDNSSGQLGIYNYNCTTNNNNSSNSSSNNSNTNGNIHKVTRVDTLWNHKPYPKCAIAISASDQSTMALISGTNKQQEQEQQHQQNKRNGFNINTIYYWGNGNSTPCKVQLDSFDTKTNTIINPIAISCAKYHNVAITSNGQVYSWGLHSEPLGTQNHKSNNGSISNNKLGSNTSISRNRSSSIESDKSNHIISTKSTKRGNQYTYTSNTTSSSLSMPKLVTGMLPENGGGKVVAVSASENHTAVITEDGHLWTWGDTYQQNVLGHVGIKWQPEPKRVPGIHRAVAVAVAKEHTVVLVGTSFPPIPSIIDHPSTGQFENDAPWYDEDYLQTTKPTFPTLEDLAAQTIAKHCDLFNVIPIMTIAERTQTKLLLQYCKEFVRLNLDGVLNVSQKSAMDIYLNEQLIGSSLDRSEGTYRDDAIHPLISDVILAGSDDRESFSKDRLCNVDKWLRACTELSQQPLVGTLLKRFQNSMSAKVPTSNVQSNVEYSKASPTETQEKIQLNPRKNSFVAERYNELTSNMDISTKDLAEAKLSCLTKEARAIRKRLAQISKLETTCQQKMTPLTDEQKQKVARRYQLETALKKFDPMIERVENKIRSLLLIENHERMKGESDEPNAKVTTPEHNDDDNDNENEKLDIVQAESISPQNNCQRCDVCQITCPDSKSYELHINGRKHRNRVSQVATDETKQVAATIHEEQKKQLLLQPERNPVKPKSEKKQCVWGQATITSVNPKYTLPPPPHPIADSIVTPSKPGRNTMSLQEIMAEEAKKSKKLSAAKNGFMLKLPPGCPATLKSPPWETKAAVKTSLHQREISNTDPGGSTTNTPPTMTTPKSTYSLGDFIPSPPPPPPQTQVTSSTVKVSRPAVPWTTPAKCAAPSVRIKDIQEQEQEFKLKQDQTFGSPNSNNKWFIEQRERAGSFKEILGETAKEIEERLLIEEQRRIEKQIYDDIAAAKAASNATTTKSNRGKRTKRKERTNDKKASNQKQHTRISQSEK